MEKFALAVSRFRRNRLDDCIKLCDELLQEKSDDLAVQLLKTHCIRRKNYLDDLELDDEEIGDILLDDNKLSTAPRPGTSLQRIGTSMKGFGQNQLTKPMTSSGRPLSGVVRPGSIRGTSSSQNRLQTVSKTQRLGTTRATTSGGRYVRLATASLQSLNSSLSLNVADINPKTVVKRRSVAKAVVDYLFYVEKNFRKMLEICSEGTIASNFNDWWWKFKLGKCYYKVLKYLKKLGMIDEAEKQLLSSLKQFSYVNTVLQLSQLYIKIDQPLKSLELLSKHSNDNQAEIYYLTYQARIHEMMNNIDNSMQLYKNILNLDNCNFEAIACIGANHFYADQPEISLKFYKRLFELGIYSAEIWNNIGLCAYYSGQYDLCLSCFERAIFLAEDDISADIWYNISHIAIGIGDLVLAYQALKIAVSYDGDHYEAFNNLGVLEIKKGNLEQAKSNFLLACKNSEYSFEPFYNFAALRYKQGNLEESLKFVKKSREIFAEHYESRDLEEKINKEIII